MKTPMESRRIAGNHHGYSATRIDALGASEYTLVAIAADRSPSVEAFRPDMERCLAAIAGACRRSPRADNVMLRTAAFDQGLKEVHGFVPAPAVDARAYAGCLRPGSATALYDAAHNAVASVVGYGRDLRSRHFAVNGVVFVITDGCDNCSRLGAAEVRAALAEAARGEALQSMLAVLVGVNVSDAEVGRELMDFSAKGGFHQYIELAKADEATLFRLASFASRSIHASSVALGSGADLPDLGF